MTEKFFDATVDFNLDEFRTKPPVDFSLEGFKADLKELFDREELTQWEVGDLLLDAERLTGITDDDWNSGKAKALRREAVRASKKQWGTLKNYKSISRKFPKQTDDGPPSLRSDTLSYGVYVLVAPFSRDHQIKLLRRAEKEVKSGKSWTVNDMRDEIRREQKWGGLPLTAKQEKQREKPVVLKFEVNARELEYLRRIARVKGLRSAADALCWLAEQYTKEHAEEIKAELKALSTNEEENRKRNEADEARRREKNEAQLKAMDEELLNDVDDKIPSY